MSAAAHQIPVFVSLGKVYTETQRRVVRLVYARLSQDGLVPVTLERVLWNPTDPMRAIVDLMRQCAGVLAIAFPRYAYHDILEFPDAPAPKPLGDRLVPTMWNQIETALAYALETPLVSLVDVRLFNEALLNPAHTAYNVVPFALADVADALPADVDAALARFASQVRAKRRSARMSQADRRLIASLIQIEG